MGMPITIIDNNIHRFEFQGREMLFHIPTSGIFELDDVGASVLNNFKFNKQIALNDLQERMANFDPVLVNEVVSELSALNVLNDGRDQREENTLKKIDHFPLTTVVLNVNTGCNLSCTYCYKEDLVPASKGQKMVFETAKNSIEMLLKESPDQARYNIVFFGGEPLSSMPLIKQVVDYANQRFSALSKMVDFSLTTNATMLTPEIADYFQKHRFGVSISMDGPKTIHDKNRITVSGQGTYGVVVEKLRMLQQRYSARPIGARVTLTSGVTDVEAIWDHLFNKLHFHEVGFAPVTSGDISDFNLTNEELKEVFASMKRLGKRYVAAAIEGRNIGFSNLHQMLTDLMEGTKKALPCGAGVGMVAIDYEGGVNLCHRFTGSDLPTFGDVDSGLKHIELSEFVEARLDRTDEGCNTCSIRNLCSGGCYHESYAKYNDPIKPTYHYCDLMRDWVDFSLWAYTSIMEHNPDFFEQHIVPRKAA